MTTYFINTNHQRLVQRAQTSFPATISNVETEEQINRSNKVHFLPRITRVYLPGYDGRNRPPQHVHIYNCSNALGFGQL